MNRDEMYVVIGLDPDADYVAECPVCGDGEYHDWMLDFGLGAPLGSGVICCPKGPVSASKELAVVKEEVSDAL